MCSEEFGLEGIPIRFYLRDDAYKKEKRKIEKLDKVGRIKDIFLRKRRLARSAKSKLEELGRSKAPPSS